MMGKVLRTKIFRALSELRAQGVLTALSVTALGKLMASLKHQKWNVHTKKPFRLICGDGDGKAHFHWISDHFDCIPGRAGGLHWINYFCAFVIVVGQAGPKPLL